MKTYFITEKFLKDFTGFNNNIDITKTEYIIKLVYDIQLVELLGIHFSNHLLNLHQNVINGIYTYTPLEEGLVDLIQYVMAWGVNIKAVAELSETLYNKGLQRQNGDFEFPASKYTRKQDEYTLNYEGYKRRLVNYLCENGEQFPEFMDKLNDDSLIKQTCGYCGNGDELFDVGFYGI